jgi:hypothetical protein
MGHHESGEPGAEEVVRAIDESEAKETGSDGGQRSADP